MPAKTAADAAPEGPPGEYSSVSFPRWGALAYATAGGATTVGKRIGDIAFDGHVVDG